MQLSDAPLPPGAHLSDRYEVLSLLGTGTAGHVYCVRDLHLDREVALKLFRPKPGVPATWDEAQLLSRLESEYLVPVFNADVLLDLDLRYITMQVMVGGDLVGKARGLGVDPLQAILWGRQVAVGLDRIHADNLLHRDVKPENVYIAERGGVRLGDLGMAARTDADGRTPPYGTWATVAPEVVLDGGSCTKASDIYSLAATAFYLLAGQYPVNTRGDTQTVAARVKGGEIRRLRNLAPHVSQSLSAVVERGLSIDPGSRQTTAIEFANQLAAARCHRLAWRRIVDHDGHGLCLRGTNKPRSTVVNLCAIASGTRWRIEATSKSGRRIGKYEHDDLAYDRMLVELRRITGNA